MKIDDRDLNSNETSIIKELNQLEISVLKDEKLHLFLAKKDSVDYIYNTSALEGNAMTYPEVATLLDGVTVGGHKLSDEHMILNQKNSLKLFFDLIDSKSFDLSKETLHKLHSQVAKEEALSWGEFRDNNVRIGGTEYIPLKHSMLNDVYKNNSNFLMKITHPIIQAFVCFLLNAKSQYFYDGNKRTARLMMNGILLSNGYPLLNIKAKDKLEFNKIMIEYYDTNNLIKAVKFLLKYYLNQIDELK